MKSLNPEPKPAAGGRQKTGVLLINLGTPAAPTAAAVRPYLRSFLSDRRIVDLPALLWQPLLRGVILPLRAKKSAANYAKVWFKEGSPLEVFTRRQCEGLQSRLPEDVAVAYAMSYSEPSIPSAIEALKAQGVGRLLVLPLYPQYAGSSSGAALDQVHDALKRQRNQMSLRTVSRFYDHPAYIGAQAAQIRNYRAQHGSGGKLLFSFHGIPLRHERNGDPYQSECRHSARLIAAELGLGEQDYEVCFQSRFGPAKCLEPNTRRKKTRAAASTSPAPALLPTASKPWKKSPSAAASFSMPPAAATTTTSPASTTTPTGSTRWRKSCAKTAPAGCNPLSGCLKAA